MTEIEETKLVCDQCGATTLKQVNFGGANHHGWFVVERFDGRVVSVEDNGPWHFCCNSCCVEFMKGQEG